MTLLIQTSSMWKSRKQLTTKTLGVELRDHVVQCVQKESKTVHIV